MTFHSFFKNCVYSPKQISEQIIMVTSNCQIIVVDLIWFLAKAVITVIAVSLRSESSVTETPSIQSPLHMHNLCLNL